MISGGFRDGLLRLWDKESNELLSERQTGAKALWILVGGESKVAVASRLRQGTQLLEVLELGRL